MSIPEILPAHEKILKVLACGICGTDIKMWQQGHPELSLPRILGHEIVGECVLTQKRYAVWPGIACGSCSYCLSPYENLCPSIRIIGFSRDGGWCDYIAAPESSLIPIPDNLSPEHAALAEPLACAINGWDQCLPTMKSSPRTSIIGGGVLGLMLAWIGKRLGAEIHLSECDPEQILRIQPIIDQLNISVTPNPRERWAQVALNAAPSISAVQSALSSLMPTGTWCFFSGLKGSSESSNGLWNIIHYHQIHAVGAHGCTRNQMMRALNHLAEDPTLASLFIESILPLDTIIDRIHDISTGGKLKLIIKP